MVSPWLSSKESACNAGDTGDMGSNLWSGRSPGGRHGNSLQYSCLENPMDRGAWWATVHRVTKSRTWLKQLSKQFKADVTVSGCQEPQISLSGDSAISRKLLISTWSNRAHHCVHILTNRTRMGRGGLYSSQKRWVWKLFMPPILVH